MFCFKTVTFGFMTYVYFLFFIYLFDSDHKGPYANIHKIHTSIVVVFLHVKLFVYDTATAICGKTQC